jgi:hypothetical protein
MGLYLKPKYRVISAVLGEEFSSPTGVDVYLDLNSIVSTLSSASKFMNSLPFSEDAEKDIVANILGVVKHWKDFFRKYDGSRIFLLWNDFEMKPLPEQEVIQVYLKSYQTKFQQDRYKQFVYYWTEAMKKVEIVLKYVPNSYLIKTNFVDSFIVPAMISGENRMKLIVSGNQLFTSYSFYPNTKVMYSRFSRHGNTHLSDPMMICQSISKIDLDVMNIFCQNEVFYNLLQAIIGDLERGIMGMTSFGITNFATELLRAVEKHKITNDPKSIESVLPCINTNYHDYLKQAYPLINIKAHLSLIPPSVIEKTKSLLIDLLDIDGLSKISIDGMNLLELL